MSLDQLRELRSTIVRLKHLPFTKLTEVLFTESPPSEGDHTGSARICEDSPAFAYEFRGHCEAEATRTLFEDVESILKIREKEARSVACTQVYFNTRARLSKEQSDGDNLTRLNPRR